jgi:hypothetical protein
MTPNDEETCGMTVIELQYDLLSSSFSALDNQASQVFEDRELYLLSISPSGLETDVEVFDLGGFEPAHA